MRRVICRFEDGDTFLEHFVSEDDHESGQPGLFFRAAAGLAVDDVVRLVVIVSDPGERHTVHVRIDDRSPTLGDDTDLQWQYRAAATAADAPWLEMMAEKVETARKLGPSSGPTNTGRSSMAGQ